jgi:outer membrane protein TolC
MKNIFFVLTALVAFLKTDAQKIFTEDDLIAIVKKLHPVAKQAALEIRIADANVTSSRAGFDPVLQTQQNRKEWDGITYYDQSVTELKIPTWYGIDIYTGSETISGGRLNPEQTKGTITYLGVNVPLVQNLLLDKRRAALQQAKVLRDQSEVYRRIVLNDLLQEALFSYWEWWQYYHMYKLVQSSLATAEKRLQMIITLSRIGELPAIDTLEAYTQVQLFRLQENEALTELAKAQLELSTFLWKEDGTAYMLPQDVVPASGTKNNELTLENFLTISNSHPELLDYNYRLNFFEIERRLKFQSLLPEVNLKYNQTGQNFSKTINSAWFQNSYRFGISLAVPLRLSEGRGGYQAARLKMQQVQLSRENKQVQIQNKVKQFFTEWQQTQKQINMQQNLVNNFLTLQRGEEIKLQNGESSLFMINAREQKTLEAQQKLIEIQTKNRIVKVKMEGTAGLYSNIN